MQLYTRDNIRFEKGKGWICKATDKLLYKPAIGVNRRLYGKPKPFTGEQAKRVADGANQHTAIELGKSEHAGLLAWEQGKQALGREIFVFGDLFGMPVIGFIDAVYTAHDELLLVDYKFTGLPPNKACQEWAYAKYRPTQVCYAKLFYDCYAQKIANCGILFLHNGDSNFASTFCGIPRESFADGYTEASRLASSAKPWG